MCDNGGFYDRQLLIVYAVKLIYTATEPGSVIDRRNEKLAQRLHFEFLIKGFLRPIIYGSQANKNENKIVSNRGQFKIDNRKRDLD